MEIRVLGYDPEADELDLLIGVERPVPAESVPVGEGVYVRVDPDAGHVVGAMIRGYRRFVVRINTGHPLSHQEARAAGFEQILEAIVEWQRDLNRLAQELCRRLHRTTAQAALWQTLLLAVEAAPAQVLTAYTSPDSLQVYLPE